MSSKNADASKVANPYLGMKADWEMKILAIVSVFASVKLAQSLLGTIIPTIICQAIFAAGHLYFVYIYMTTTSKVNKSTSRSSEEKVKIKEACFSIFKALLVRAIIIIAIHWRTGLMPPLVVSVFMGFFSMIENDYYYQVMYSVSPRLFDTLYS
jgi:hypothetical protein